MKPDLATAPQGVGDARGVTDEASRVLVRRERELMSLHGLAAGSANRAEDVQVAVVVDVGAVTAMPVDGAEGVGRRIAEAARPVHGQAGHLVAMAAVEDVPVAVAVEVGGEAVEGQGPLRQTRRGRHVLDREAARVARGRQGDGGGPEPRARDAVAAGGRVGRVALEQRGDVLDLAGLPPGLHVAHPDAPAASLRRGCRRHVTGVQDEERGTDVGHGDGARVRGRHVHDLRADVDRHAEDVQGPGAARLPRDEATRLALLVGRLGARDPEAPVVTGGHRARHGGGLVGPGQRPPRPAPAVPVEQHGDVVDRCPWAPGSRPPTRPARWASPHR